MQIQAPGRVRHRVRDQLVGGYGVLEEDVFHKLDLVLFLPVGVRQRAAAETDGQNGAVDHPRGDLVVVAVAQRVVGLVDTF